MEDYQRVVYSNWEYAKLQYRAPELLHKDPNPHEFDIWPVGCVIYELVTTKSPFGHEHMNRIKPKINRDRLPNSPAWQAPNM